MLHRTLKTIGAVVLALSLSVTAAACSGDDKPSKDEFTKALVDEFGEGETAEKAAECLADETYDDLSAEAVTAIVEGDDEYEGSEEDQKALEDAMEACTSVLLE